MLNRKDVRIEVGDPLFAFLRHAQIMQAILDIPVDHIPIKSGIVLAQLPWVFVAQFRVGPGFFEFVNRAGNFRI